MCLGSKSKINDFILEDRTKILLTLEHGVLGITIDTNLNFYRHLKQLCKKVANKLNALTRIIPHLDKKQINLLYYSFFKGQINYSLRNPRSLTSNCKSTVKYGINSII